MQNLVPIHKLEFETAAEHLTRNVPIASPLCTAKSIRESLAGKTFDTATEIVVCDDGRMSGLLAIESLLAAPDAALARDLMDDDPPLVEPGVDQEIAAWKAVKHGERSLAVVDGDGRFLGLIPSRRLMEVLLWEHDEDIARLGGFMHSSYEAQSASEEPVLRRLWHRLPWLLVGLLGAALSADLMGLFQQHLQEHIVIAFFVPGIVYLADAVGTQTETLVVRGFSVGVPLSRILLRELVTGILIGGALGSLFFPFAYLRWGRLDLAWSVSLALLAACSISTSVAMALPWILRRCGSDPAFGSGPLATVIQDLLSVWIYFTLTLLIVS